MGEEKSLQMLSHQLQNTLSLQEETRTNATKWLDSAKGTKGFSVMLLKLLGTNTAIEIRHAGAIYFKNLIMFNWVPDEDQKDIIPVEDRNAIKDHILNLMLSTPKQVQSQLSHALGIISQSDFPEKWPKLLPGLVHHLSSDNFDKLYGVLETAHAIFHRYRTEMKSEPLWKEIKYVLEGCQAPFTELFKKMCAKVASPPDAVALKQTFQILHLIAEIFQSLNSQDLPEYFEDNLDDWMGNYENFLKYSNAALDPKESDKPGLVEQLQGTICDICNLFTSQYEEPFQKWVPRFVMTIWTLLTKLSESERYDQLVAKAIAFLTTVVKREWHKGLFSKENELKAICEKVVIPQLKLRAADVELFQMNGLEYLRRDIEGSDQETRRRMTIDFVRGLCVHFESQVTNILKVYISKLLADYATDPANKWMQKDAAMYLALALSVKGKVGSKGVTQTNPFFPIKEFLGSQVIPELKKDVKVTPVLKAGCLKFIAEFRNQIPKEHYAPLLQLIYRHLASDEYVVHTYAAYALERLLTKSDESGPWINKDQIKPHLQPILGALFATLQKEESKENQYIVRAIMRVCATAQENISSFVKIIMMSLTKILGQVAKNPRNPFFNHYLFETQSCIIKYICKTAPAQVVNFESALFPPFQTMLVMESCQEFGPYVFQILSQMLELRPDVSGPYQRIFGTLLRPQLWKMKGNVPALTRLLCAYVRKKHEVVTKNLEGMLGIFQKLNANSKEDVYGFELLSAVVESLPKPSFEKYFQEIIRLLLTRQQSKPTIPFTRHCITFFCLFISKHGLEPLIGAVEKLHGGLFANFMSKVWIPNAPRITGKIEAKTAVVGMAHLLCNQPLMLSEQYVRLWPGLLSSALTLTAGGLEPADKKSGEVAAEAAAAAAAAADDASQDLVDAGSFKAAFVKLHYATISQHDPHPDVKSPEEFLIKSLNQLAMRFPGKLPTLLKAVEEKPQTILRQLCSQFQVVLQ